MMSDVWEYKYKFSIIMSIYNVEDYLEEAIDSLLCQTIDFEKNVQLILINDGSPDHSEDICLKYQARFPHNIKYVKKQNGGLSSAKNCGLQFREGKYINFFDPDDIMEPNTLAEVYKFFERNYNTIPLVAIPLCFFEAMTGIHPKYKYMGSKNRIINLAIEPYNFVLSSASVFYKTEHFDALSFDESMTGEEDTKLNFQIFRTQPSLGYVCQKGVKYNYRKRNVGGSIGDQSATNVKAYLAVIAIFDEILKGISAENIPDYVKELILYETRSRIKNLNKATLGKDYDYIVQKYKEYLSLIDVHYIFQHSRWVTKKEEKYFYASDFLRNKNIYEINTNGFVEYNSLNIFPISDLPVQVQEISFLKDYIRFSVVYWDYNIAGLSLVAKNEKGKVFAPEHMHRAPSPFDKKIGSQNICDATYCEFLVPYQKQKIEFFYRNAKNDLLYRANYIDVTSYSYFALKQRFLCAFHKNYKIVFYKTGFSIRKHSTPSYKYNLSTFLKIWKKYRVNAFYRLFNRRFKQYILVNDRPEKAADNGEAIFRYIRSNEKDLAKHTFYVLEKNSPDYQRLKKYSHIVKKGSFKHKLLFINSRAILSSHLVLDFYSPFPSTEIVYYRDMLTYKLIWLQHGITQNDVSVAANKYRKGLSYVVTATNKEYEEFTKSKYAFKPEDVILCGFPRYDKLIDRSENVITLAPTWRAYLTGKISANGFHETKDGFYKSEYYQKYSRILGDKNLYTSLKERKIKLKFLLHPGMLGYVDGFKKFENDCIEIVDIKDIDYSKTFAESKLLITDYSSVFFDFAYLKKPVIYYQFDHKDFFGKHYKKGYFEYERDGFGSVVYDHEALLDRIESYMHNDFKMEDMYLERVNKTFQYHDHKNCERLIAYLRDNKVL